MKIGFDFDGTIDFDNLWSHRLVNSLMKDPNNEFFLITTRIEPKENKLTDFATITSQNKVVLEVAEKLGIKIENIFFTNFEWKHSLIEKLNLDLFFDNDEVEVHLINSTCSKCQAILVGFTINPEWLIDIAKRSKSGFQL